MLPEVVFGFEGRVLLVVKDGFVLEHKGVGYSDVRDALFLNKAWAAVGDVVKVRVELVEKALQDSVSADAIVYYARVYAFSPSCIFLDFVSVEGRTGFERLIRKVFEDRGKVSSVFLEDNSFYVDDIVRITLIKKVATS